MRSLRQVPLALLLFIVLTPALSVADTVPVAINGLFFSPNPVVVKEGDTIVWTNNTISNHTVTSGNPCTSDGTFNSGLFAQGQTYMRTFNTAGTIPYFCIPHCFSGMTGTIIVEVPVGIGDLPTKDVALGQNYPNPFNPATTIEYTVNRAARVEIAVFTASGRFVKQLVEIDRAPGTYAVEWDGTSARGVAQASGVYYYRLTLNGVSTDVRKMILLK